MEKSSISEVDSVFVKSSKRKKDKRKMINLLVEGEREVKLGENFIYWRREFTTQLAKCLGECMLLKNREVIDSR